MNVLPLILALVLMLSVLTVERLEKFKNQTAVQKEYQVFLQENERQVFNQRQKNLYGDNQKSLRQLSFRYFVDKELRKKDSNVTKQYRLLMIELMKIVYGKASFFKELENKRENFLEEMLNSIEKAADEAPDKFIRSIQDIARLKLDDPELQQAFYHMLKGTIERDELEKLEQASDRMQKKAYISLFTFIHYAEQKIMIQRAPKEILKAVFGDDGIVEKIIIRRNELAAQQDSGAKMAFESEFKDKRPGIDDKLLDFSISTTDKTDYN